MTDPSITVAQVRQLAHHLGYRPVKSTRMVHRDYLKNGTEMRTAGFNLATVVANGGVLGPAAVEITYGSQTVRVRGFYGDELVGLVDFTPGTFEHASADLVTLDAALHERIAADRRAFEGGQ